ncbi:peptide-methionine (S)-S-oxide reductase MsrA [Microbulbifer sp. THAF38]|uniref:peptide-methionine (S)-S-oxide reductase MsrA n=1 Tax=Microbulbifer sp. THAF38 TaxID=2587856 RepID=UPI001269843A|nr:peptide-methionine (S)-S-oxide reductase MsrA [Microbulbifer sp. THAF38]QFT56179.1 Peptide methionine sulfoxide reductase MsrA [Microbulbifer sp. THAF38]
MRVILALFILFAATLGYAQDSPNIRTAIFAGGCFWCMEPPYDKVNGVLETTSGYSGGHVKNPSYDQVSAGGTGHAEVVQVKYDADKVSYSELLNIFWHNVDPFDAGGQFCDRGDQYRAEIFYGNEEEKKLAEESKKKVESELGKKVVTQIKPAATFYPAEAYHQNYYQRNPLRYKYYRFRCGRDQRLEEVWGKGKSKSKS